VLNVQLSKHLRLVAGMHMNEVGRLGESINNHSIGIILAGSERHTHNEIHADISHFQIGIFNGCSNRHVSDDLP
jgi:hypothetical protein